MYLAAAAILFGTAVEPAELMPVVVLVRHVAPRAEIHSGAVEAGPPHSDDLGCDGGGGAAS